MIGKLIKLLLFLAVVGFAGLVGYAYLGDLTPDRNEERIPVTLNAD